jgi:heat shock protein HslJ
VTAGRLLLAIVTVVVVLGACASPPPSPSPARSDGPLTTPSGTTTTSPSSTPPALDGPAIELPGTAWQARQMRGAPIPGRPPELWFDPTGRPSGTGFTGCEEFGWDADFADGRVAVGELSTAPFECERPLDASVEAAFLEIFRATTTYAVGGDALVIAGGAGDVVFARLAPPMDDRSRGSFDVLRRGDWALVHATGVVAPELLAHARFADRWLTSAGDCGYTGRVRFGPEGRVDFEEIGWDSMACPGDADARERDRRALQRVLEGVESYALDPEDGMRFTGPAVEALFRPA